MCILTLDERNLNIAGAITGRGLFCVALPDEAGPADTIAGGWCAPWGFDGRTRIWFADGAAVTGEPYREVNSKVATAPNTQSRR